MGGTVTHGKILTLHAGDASLTHGFGLANMCLDELPILLDEDADSKQKNCYPNNYDTKKKYFQHFFVILQHENRLLAKAEPLADALWSMVDCAILIAKIRLKNVVTLRFGSFLTLFSKKDVVFG